MMLFDASPHAKGHLQTVHAVVGALTDYLALAVRGFHHMVGDAHAVVGTLLSRRSSCFCR